MFLLWQSHGSASDEIELEDFPRTSTHSNIPSNSDATDSSTAITIKKAKRRLDTLQYWEYVTILSLA